MKDFRGMKRQRSRNRKPSGNQSNPNRAYESNGPEGTKVRGNAQTIYEKYQQLARDANSSGDRVLAENHLQHAEHYFRMIRQMQPTRPVSEFVQRDPFSNGFDDYDDDMDGNDGEQDENAVVGAEDAQPSFDEPVRYENRDNNNRDRNNNGNFKDRDRNNGQGNFKDRDRNFKDREFRDRDRNNDRQQSDRPQGDRFQNDRPQNDRPQNDRPQADRQQGEPRSFEPRQNNNQNSNPNFAANNAPAQPEYDENGNRRETRRERYERRRQQRFAEQEQNLNGTAQPAAEQPYVAPAFIASTQPLAPASTSRSAPVQTDMAFEPAPALVSEKPKREKRAHAATPVSANASSDAAQLPAFLHRATPVTAAPEAPVAEAEDAPAKPKRGRPKRKVEDVGASEEA